MMANNKGKNVDALALLAGEGALTYEEAQTLAAQYRTASKSEDLARLKRARIVYVVKRRGALDATGSVVTGEALAREWGVSGASVTQLSDAYAYVVALGLTGESDASQRDALVAAERVRKMGKSDAVKDAVHAGLQPILALPVGERAAAFDAATRAKGEIAEMVKAAKSVDRGSERQSGERGEASEVASEKSAPSVSPSRVALDGLTAALGAVSEYGTTWAPETLEAVGAKVAALQDALAAAAALVEEHQPA